MKLFSKEFLSLPNYFLILKKKKKQLHEEKTFKFLIMIIYLRVNA